MLKEIKYKFRFPVRQTGTHEIILEVERGVGPSGGFFVSRSCWDVTLSPSGDPLPFPPSPPRHAALLL